MTEIIEKLIASIKEVRNLKKELENKEYWINRAKEEAGFIPEKDDWISIEVSSYIIRVSVYHKHNSGKNVYWINGQWFDTPFPKESPII